MGHRIRNVENYLSSVYRSNRSVVLMKRSIEFKFFWKNDKKDIKKLFRLLRREILKVFQEKLKEDRYFETGFE